MKCPRAYQCLYAMSVSVLLFLHPTLPLRAPACDANPNPLHLEEWGLGEYSHNFAVQAASTTALQSAHHKP